MTRADVLKILVWMSRSGIEADELTLFQTAYYNIHGKVSLACGWTFDHYMRTGEVPSYVVSFIRNTFIMKGV